MVFMLILGAEISINFVNKILFFGTLIPVIVEKL